MRSISSAANHSSSFSVAATTLYKRTFGKTFHTSIFLIFFLAFATSALGASVSVDSQQSSAFVGGTADFSFSASTQLNDGGKCYDYVPECSWSWDRVSSCSGYSQCKSSTETYASTCYRDENYLCQKTRTVPSTCTERYACGCMQVPYSCQKTRTVQKTCYRWVWRWWPPGFVSQPYDCSYTENYWTTCYRGETMYCDRTYTCYKQEPYWDTCTRTVPYSCEKTRTVYDAYVPHCTTKAVEVGVSRTWSASGSASVQGPKGELYGQSIGSSGSTCYRYSDYCVLGWWPCWYPSVGSSRSVFSDTAHVKMSSAGTYTGTISLSDNFGSSTDSESLAAKSISIIGISMPNEVYAGDEFNVDVKLRDIYYENWYGAYWASAKVTANIDGNDFTQTFSDSCLYPIVCYVPSAMRWFSNLLFGDTTVTVSGVSTEQLGTRTVHVDVYDYGSETSDSGSKTIFAKDKPFVLAVTTNVEGVLITAGGKACTTSKAAWDIGKDPSCQISEMSRGTYTVVATKSGYISQSKSVSGPPDQQMSFTLLPETFSVTASTNVASVLIESGGKSCKTTLDAWSGSYRCTLSGFPQGGSYTITASRPSYYAQSKTATGPFDQTVSFTMQKKPLQVTNVAVTAVYKKCEIKTEGNESQWLCNENYEEANPSTVYGGSKLRISYDVIGATTDSYWRWVVASGVSAGQYIAYTALPQWTGTGEPAHIEQEIMLPRSVSADSVNLTVFDLGGSCSGIMITSCDSVKKSLDIRVVPHPNVEMRDFKICYNMPEDNGTCDREVQSTTSSMGLRTYRISPGRDFALYFKLYNFEYAGIANAWTELELDEPAPLLQAGQKLVNGIGSHADATDEDYLGYMPIIWVFNSSDEGLHYINIKTTDLQDGERAEKQMSLGVSLNADGSPFQYGPGYGPEARPIMEDLLALQKEYETNIGNGVDVQATQQSLAQVNVLISLFGARQATVVEHGAIEPIPTLLNQIGSAITGFGQWLWNGITGIGQALVNFVNDPIGTLTSAWNWIIVPENFFHALDVAIMVATVAVIVAGVIATGGLLAGLAAYPLALLALDVATVASILGKAAVLGQSLDAFDIVTLGLVGFANAGAISRVLTTDDRLTVLLRNINENPVLKAKLTKQLEKMTGKLGRQAESIADVSKIVDDASNLKWLDNLLNRIRTPVKIMGDSPEAGVQLLSKAQREAVYYAIGNVKSAEARLAQLSRPGETVKNVEIIDFAIDRRFKQYADTASGVYIDETKTVYININERYLANVEKTSNLATDVFNTVNHEFLHSVEWPRYGSRVDEIVGKHVQEVFGLSDDEVAVLIRNNELRGRPDVNDYWSMAGNEAHDLIALRMSDTLGTTKSGLYSASYIGSLENEVMTVLNKGTLAEIRRFFDPLGQAKAAELLAFKTDAEAAKIASQISMAGVPIKDILKLRETYITVMKLV